MTRSRSHISIGTVITWSRDSSVGIATRYGLGGPGIEYRWGEIFRTYPDRLRGPPSLLYNGYRVFPGGKGGRGVMLTTHPLIVPRLRKSWAITPLTLWVLLGLLRGYLYLYSNYLLLYASVGSWSSVVVNALRYKSDGPGIDSRWCHWIFQWHISFRPFHGPGVDLAPSENEYQEHSWR
jgi:hypothetical protein